ncbi:MAG: PQQ-dependent sugar dehydrogenase [Gammaproteobacteria bacterium]
MENRAAGLPDAAPAPPPGGCRGITVALLCLALGGCAAGTPPGDRAPAPPLPGLKLKPVVTGLPEITAVAHAGDGSDRLFLATQRGRVLVVDGDALLPEPLLDIRDRVGCCGERGLLGIAFDPHFSETGRLYASYTDKAGDSVIARFRLGTDGAVREEEVILTIDQPTAIHNGGAIAFGPDGMLYAATGDGGHFDANAPDNSGRDPDNRGQRLDTLLGKILRLEVSGTGPYRIPDDNPYRQTTGARGEIWASGLRNPWRMSFDRLTGDLFIADVGPSQWEEINHLPAGEGGANFGWSAMLGNDCFNEFRCDTGRYRAPILLYDHDSGCAVIGGYRYRGARIPALRGIYLFSDFCSGVLYGGEEVSPGRWRMRRLLATGLRISTFGEDESGEILLVHYHGERGALYRLEPGAPSGHPVDRPPTR